MNPELEHMVQRLTDRAAISDVLMSYFRGIDRLDLELVRGCFHADATDSHGGFTGPVDEFLDWVRPLLDSYDSTFHFAGNLLIDFDGDDAARSELYGIAHHRTADGPARQNLITGFRFIDRVERRDGHTWLIAARVAVTEWVRVDDEEDWFPYPESYLAGRRDRSDPLYALGPNP
jgi:hypothetical protein